MPLWARRVALARRTRSFRPGATPPHATVGVADGTAGGSSRRGGRGRGGGRRGAGSTCADGHTCADELAGKSCRSSMGWMKCEAVGPRRTSRACPTRPAHAQVRWFGTARAGAGARDDPDAVQRRVIHPPHRYPPRTGAHDGPRGPARGGRAGSRGRPQAHPAVNVGGAASRHLAAPSTRWMCALAPACRGPGLTVRSLSCRDRDLHVDERRAARRAHEHEDAVECLGAIPQAR